MLLNRVLYGSVTTGLCTFEASRLFLGITVVLGTDGFRVERRCLLSLRCLWRWIGTLVLGICAMGWIRDDPARQHGNEMLTLLAAHASAVCDTEAPPAHVQTTSPGSCCQRPFALNEVVGNRLALQAICSAVMIPRSPSSPCATPSSELSEISPQSLLETQTNLLDVRLCPFHLRAPGQDATFGVLHTEVLNVVICLEIGPSMHPALYWISVCACP